MPVAGGPGRSLPQHRHLSLLRPSSSKDIGAEGKTPEMKRSPKGLGELILKLREGSLPIPEKTSKPRTSASTSWPIPWADSSAALSAEPDHRFAEARGRWTSSSPTRRRTTASISASRETSRSGCRLRHEQRSTAGDCGPLGLKPAMQDKDSVDLLTNYPTHHGSSIWSAPTRATTSVAAGLSSGGRGRRQRRPGADQRTPPRDNERTTGSSLRRRRSCIAATPDSSASSTAKRVIRTWFDSSTATSARTAPRYR